MDPREISIQRLKAGLLLLALAALPSGCRRPETPAGGPRSAAAGKGQRAERRNPAQSASISVEARGGNTITVDDAQGRRVLEARVERVDGVIRPGTGVEGPVRLRDARCRLFQSGRLQMEIDSPAAVWDGERLLAEREAHAVTADGKTVIDAAKATWTSTTGHLALEEATLQSRKQGRTDFTARARRADVADRVVTMPAGAAAHNAAGQQLTADHVRWHLESGRLEASGNVVLTEGGTRVSGQRLAADTRLKKGRLSGGTRLQVKKGALPVRGGGAPQGAGAAGPGIPGSRTG